MHFFHLLSSKEAISCFHLWNNPFSRHNHCFKSLQLVNVVNVSFILLVMLHYIHCNLVWQIGGRSEAWSNQWWGPSAPKEDAEVRTGTVLLPPSPQWPRSQWWVAVWKHWGRVMCALFRGERWVEPGSEDDDPCHSDELPLYHGWHSDPRGCVCWGASCGCLQQGNPESETYQQRWKRLENWDHLFFVAWTEWKVGEEKLLLVQLTPGMDWVKPLNADEVYCGCWPPVCSCNAAACASPARWDSLESYSFVIRNVTSPQPWANCCF